MEAELNNVQEEKKESVDKGWYSYFLWLNDGGTVSDC